MARAISSSVLRIDENYDLRGLNLSSPDEVMGKNESPYTTNSRMYARNDGESRVANRTRKGAGHFSSPVGVALNLQNISAAIGNQDFSATKVYATPVVFSGVTGSRITRLDTEMKRIGAASGHVIVEFRTDNGGSPGTVLAQGSVYANNITTTYQYLTAYFIEAPVLTDGVTYWLVYYTQDNGSGSYYINTTLPVTTSAKTSTLGTSTWSPLSNNARFKTYIASSGTIKGFTMRYPSATTGARVVFAHGTSVYQVPRSTGTPAAFDTGLNVSATDYYFDQWDDNTLYANSYDNLRTWDGINAPTPVPNCPTADPQGVLVWQNRVFIYKNTRVEFSELGNQTIWPSVNYFYIPITTPKSPDHIAGWRVFSDDLVVFTHRTKYQVIGSNIKNFTYKEVVGTKGGVSNKAIVADRTHLYFLSPDKQIYRWNSAGDDELLSLKVEPELQRMDDLTKVQLALSRNQLRVYYTVNGEGRMLLLDIEQSNPSHGDWRWFFDTHHPVVGACEMYLDSDNMLLEFSSLVGRVYYAEQQYSDLGRKIEYRYWTPYMSYGSGSSKKRIKRFRPVLRTQTSTYTLQVGKDMDFANRPDMRNYTVSGGGAKWGQFKWGDGTKWGKTAQIMKPAPMSGRGNFLQYRFERSGVETPVELYGYISQYKMGIPK